MDLARDKTYISCLRILKDSTEIDIDKYTVEIEDLHGRRIVRKYSTKMMGMKTLYKCSLQEQAFRSRVIEILVTISRLRNQLELAYEGTVKHILSSYYDEIPVKTQYGKESWVKSKLSKVASRINEFTTLTDNANLIIDDIDKASWTLKRQVDLATVTNQREKVL